MSRPSAGLPPFSPLSVTAANIWFDASDLSTLKQETTGASATTPAVVNGVVGSWRNKGLIGGWATAPSNSARPILKNSGSLYWLAFDGVDDTMSLATPAVGLVTLEAYIVASEASHVNNSGVVVLAPSSGDDYQQTTAIAFANGAGDINGSFGIAAAALTLLIKVLPRSDPTALAVYGVQKTASAAQLTVNNSVNGTDNSFTALAASNTGNLVLGARYLSGAVAAPFLNGTIYQVVMANSTLSAGVRTQMQTFLAAKAGL